MSIADNIKKLRAEYHLTQEELGRIVGVSDKAVSTWELGLKSPRMGTIEKLSSYFNIPKSAILDDEPAEILSTYTTESDKELLTHFHKLTDYGKQTAIKRVKEMTELPQYTIEENEKKA